MKQNDTTRVLHVTSHNEECGIARYQEQFIDGMRSDSTIKNSYFNHSPYETRFMSKQQYNKVLDDFRVQVLNNDLIHIQHELAFYKHRELKSMVKISHKFHKKVMITIHTALDVEYKRAHLKGYGFRSVLSYIKQLRIQKGFERMHLNPIKKADLIIVHNKATKQSLINHGFKKPKIKTIRMPIPTLSIKGSSTHIKKSLGYKKKDIIFCTVGFISRTKGVDQAVKALLLLPENYKLAIIGGLHPRGQDAQYLKEIEEFIKENNLESRVYISGYIKDDQKLNMYIRECDICVYPYDAEYYSYVSSAALSNAIANHKPVIAYPTPTFKEINSKSEEVVVFCQSPSVSELANKIRSLNIKKQTDISTEYAEKYNYTKEALKFASIYHKLLNKNI